jgi:hypothetical protein
VLFYLFFDFAKHSPTLVPVNPFINDPYDAIGTFGIQAGVVFGMLALLRAFRPYRSGAPSEEQRVLLIRAQVAATLAVVITLVGDVVALVRHPASWLGSAAGYELAALVGSLLILALVVGAFELRSAGGIELPSDLRRGARAIWVSLAAVAALAFYPENLTQNAQIHGALLTVLVGATLLFVPMWALVTALAPYRVPGGKRTLLSWLMAYKKQLALVAIIGILVGLLVFAREGMVEGVSRDLTRVARGAMVYMGLEAAGVLIGFVALSRALGLVPAQHRP